MSLKDNTVQTGLDALARKEDDVAKAAKKIATEAKKADNELARFAKRTTEINAAPLDKYLAVANRLKTALEAGKLSQETYNRAVQKARSDYETAQAAIDGTTARVRALAEAEEDAANKTAEKARWLAGVKAASARQEQDDALRALQVRKQAEREAAGAAEASAKKKMEWLARVRANSARLEQEQKVAANQARKEQDSLFGSGALGQLTAFAGGYLTLQTAVRLVGDAFAYARKESEDALGSLRGLDDSRRELNQVSTSQEQYAGRLSRADAAAAKFGVDRRDAYGTLTQAINFGLEGEYEQIMAGNQVVKPGASIEVGGRLASMFGGGFNAVQATSMGIAAGRPSSMTFEQFASTMAIIGEGGLQQGAGAEESMAAVGALSSDFASSKVTADRLKNFLSKASINEATKGKGLLGALDVMKAMSPEERQGILGKDQESNAAYNMLVKDEGKVRSLMQLVAAQRDNPTELAGGMARAAGTPQDVAARLDARAQNQAEIDRENQLAGPEAARNAAANQQAALANRQGLNMFSRYGASALRGMATLVGGNETAVALAGMGGEALGRNPALINPFSPGTAGASIGELLKLITGQNKFASESLQVLKDIRDAQKKTSPRAAQAEAKVLPQ